MISKNEAKFIKSLKLKKYRTRENKFLVEGYKNVKELLTSKYEVDTLICTPDYEEEFEGHHPMIVKKAELESLGTLKSNDSCMAVVQMRKPSNKIALTDDVLVFDGVADPGNLGTIIRSADWFGFKQIVCSPDSVDFYNPKVIQSTMGSFSRVEVIYSDLKQFLSSLEDRDIYGLSIDGTEVHTIPLKKPAVYVFGSESHGISPSLRNSIGHLLKIPKTGKAESLNLSIATGIMMHYLRFANLK